ncbi:trypsin-like peptidase domain-containing protein, partial [uncultured Senegalimassilia sp.]|uniref:trypsin-like peptidase domain-containing protein n=1 Tax=uncultured Senegalimassilia sp. TaxID=1714350 RepID=UPI0025EACF30
MTDQFNNQNGYGQPGQPIPPAQGYQQPGYQHSYTQPVVDAQNPRKTSSGRTFGTAFAGAALACVIAFGGFTVYQNVTGTPSGSNVTLGASTNTEIQAQSTDDTLPEAVAQKCLPSVAAIDVYTAQTSTDMFGRSTSSSGTLTESSLGSGVVLSEDGYIITNNHVVAGADALKVTVGGEEYDADVVGTDESSDIAV